MTKRELQEIFTGDPVKLAEIDGKEFVLTGVSLGNVARIGAIVEDIYSVVNVKDINLFDLGCFLKDVAKIISIACNNGKNPPHQSDAELLLSGCDVEELSLMLNEVLRRIEITPLYEHFKFKFKGKSKKYPGSGSLWSIVQSNAVMLKGWTEDDLKWNVSFQNLLMYGFVMPQIEFDDNDKSSEVETDENGNVDLFEFFENR